MNEMTQRGIAALKTGDRTTARQLLAAAVKQDPNDALAWLWLTGALDSDDERIACLRQVLRIDPGNQPAARGLAQILARRQQPAGERQGDAGTGRREDAEAAPAEPGGAASETPASTEAPASVEGDASVSPRLPVSPSPRLSRPPRVPETQTQAIDSLRAMAEMEALPPEASSVEETTAEASYRATMPETPPATAPTNAGAARTAQPIRKRATRAQEDAAAQIVFRSRPSLVPALICFWLFLIGAILIGALLGQSPEIGLLLSAGLGLILELIVLYAILRTLAVRYELTSQQITLRFQGKRARVPISNIYNAEMKQSFFQRVLGIGDIDIDAAVNGQLAHLRMRNIPQCRLRAEQIMHQVREHGPA